MDDLKIRQKCEDMIAYGYVAVRQFPKTERHVLAQEIRVTMWAILRLIIITNRRYHKKTTMQDLAWPIRSALILALLCATAWGQLASGLFQRRNAGRYISSARGDISVLEPVAEESV